MKRTIRIALALVIVGAFFMAANTGPAVAEDGSTDGVTRERPPHPCSVAGNLRLQFDSEREVLEQLSENQDRKFDELEAARDRVDDMKSEIWRTHWHDMRDCRHEGSSPEHVSAECYIRIMQDRLEWYRDHGYTDAVNREEDLLDEFQAAVADEEAARDDYYEAFHIVSEAEADLALLELRVDEAQRECDITRPAASMTERPWDSQTAKPMSMIARPMLDQMQNPMDSDANQASNEPQYVIPFGVLQEGQPPQAATGQIAMPETQTATVKSAKAHLFNKLPESSAAGASHSTPAATGQVMHVDQSGSTNTGTNSFGYTHMQLPQNAGASRAVVPPQKPLRGMVRVRQIRTQPGRSVKR